MPLYNASLLRGLTTSSSSRVGRACSRFLHRAAGSVLLIMLLSIVCLSQIDNGSIKGFITDPTGAALPGVTVSVQGPALMGTRTVKTDDLGFYRLIDLPPGEYVLSAVAPNFAKLERRSLVIRAGLTLGLDLGMKIGKTTETIEVTGQAPIIEAEKAEKSINVDGDFMRALPLAPGHDWWDALTMVPGIIMGYGTNYLINDHGAGASSNVFTLDGYDISGSQQNYPGETMIPIDALADLKITTAGHTASARMAVGAQLSLVTRSGGNAVHGTFSSDMQPKYLNDNNMPGGTPANQTIYQYSASLGGPVIVDRLWYFASYRFISSHTGISRTAAQIANLKLWDPDFEPWGPYNPTHEFLGKADFDLTKSDKITFTYQYNNTFTENNANDPTWTQERAMHMQSGGPLYGLNYRRFFGQRALLEAQAGYNLKPWNVAPQGTGPQITVYNAVSYTPLGTGVEVGKNGYPVGAITFTPGGGTTISTYPTYSGTALVNMGNVGNYNHSKQTRLNTNLTFSYFGLKLAGDHEIKVGMNLIPINKYTMTGYTSNDGFYMEYRALNVPGDPTKGTYAYQRMYQSPVVLDGVGKSAKAYGYFVQDTWRPMRKLTVNVGLRYDLAQAFDTWGQPTQKSWTGGPRFGAAYSITKDNKNVINFSYSRMFDSTNLLYSYSYGNLTKGTNTLFDLGVTPMLDASGNPVLDRWLQPAYLPTKGDGVFSGTGYDRINISPAVLTKPVYTGTAPQTLSPGLKQPRTDEWTIGYNRELPWKMNLSASLINRNYKDRVLSYDTNIIYENGIWKGVRDPNYNSIYEIRNADKSWFDYRGLTLSLHKNTSHHLQFLTGYTLARMQQKGTWEDNDPAGFLQPNAFANSGGLGQLVYPVGGQFSSYTASYYNTGTPPHNWRNNVTYEAPLGITVGFTHVYQMGQYTGPVMTRIDSTKIPDASVIGPTSMTVTNSAGQTRTISNPLATTTRFYYATRAEGQQQADTLNSINMKVGKIFRFHGERYKFHVAAQAFNLLNTNRALYWAYPSVPAVGGKSTFAKTGYQAPRAGQLSLKFDF